MSVKITAAIWQDSPYEGGEHLTLLALGDFANHSGSCFPSAAAIAKKARLGLRRTYQCLDTLKKDGVISVEKGGGRKHPSHYLIHLETMKQVSVKRDSVKPDSVKFPTETVQPTAINSAVDCKGNKEEPSLTVNKATDNHLPAPQDGAGADTFKLLPLDGTGADKQTQPGRKKKEATVSDPRFGPTKESLAAAFREVVSATESVPWDGHAGKELSDWLKANPLEQSEIAKLVDNAAHSEGAQELLRYPAGLIPKLRKFHVPLNQYGSPIGNGNGYERKPNKAEQRTASNLRALDAAFPVDR